MSKEDLIPLGQPGNEEHDKIVRSKLKGTASDKRKMAQRLTALKKAKPETIEKRAMQLVEDPKLSAIEIMRFIQTLLKNNKLNNSQKISLLGKWTGAHTAIHGNKILADITENSKQIIEVRFKEETDALKGAIRLLIDEAKCARLYEWEKKYGKDQSWDMVKCLEKFLEIHNVEKEAKEIIDYKRKIQELNKDIGEK